MASTRYEILVHVTAPGTIHDDHRYRSIAEGVMAFKPATVINLGQLSLDEADNDRMNVEHNCARPETSFDLLNRDSSTKPQLWLSQDIDISRTEESFRVEVQEQRAPRWPRNTDSPTRSSGPISISDKSHDNEWLGYDGCCDEKSPLRLISLRTPDVQRPKTAPAGGQSFIQVPLTDKLSRKRAHSESASFGELYSTVFDSQTDTSFGKGEIAQSPSTRHIVSFQPGQKLASSNTAAKQTQVTPNNPLKRRRTAKETSRMDRLAGSIVYKEGVTFTSPSFLPDQTLDWTSSSAPSTSFASTESLMSTLSPSQPLPTTCYRATAVTSGLPKDRRSTKSFHLLSMDDSTPPPTSPVWQTKTTPDPTFAQDSRLTAVSPSPSPEQLMDLSSMPMEINSPPPPTGSGSFTTHITSSLQSMVARLPLSKYFHPETVVRDIKVLERGYWRIPLRIVSPQEALQARQSPSKDQSYRKRRAELVEQYRNIVGPSGRRNQRHNGATTTSEPEQESERKQAVWTKDEFLEFWRNIAKFIPDGKAGWGVRVVRETIESDKPALALGPDALDEGIQIVVKVFSWGEITGHLWIAMWVLSDKLVAYLPMTWVAADATIVVAMTGDRYREGKLGPWMRKGPEGRDGVWGVEEASMG